MNTAMFKAYDIRGKVDADLDDVTCRQIGQAYAHWLPDQGMVAVGYDTLPSSQKIAQAVIAGLTEQGRDVYDLGRATADMVYFVVGSRELSGGVYVSVSHATDGPTSIKFCREQAWGVSMENGLADIRNLAYANDFIPANTPGDVTKLDCSEEWAKHVFSHVTPQKWPAFTVVVDASNGAAGIAAAILQKQTQLKIIAINTEPAGEVAHHDANLLDPKSLVEAQQKVQQSSADIGLVFDIDGDRLVIIDEKSQPLSGTVTTALLARYTLAKQPGATILYNAICGQVVPETILAAGGKPYRTKVGHSFIKADMRTYSAAFAGEHSGHYYFDFNYNADSGLIAAVIVLQIMAQSGKKLSELADEYRGKYVSIPETNFMVSDQQTVFIKAREAFADGEQDELDGLTIKYPTKWLNIRASNTEPLIRLNAEAQTQAELDELVERAKKIMQG